MKCYIMYSVLVNLVCINGYHDNCDNEQYYHDIRFCIIAHPQPRVTSNNMKYLYCLCLLQCWNSARHYSRCLHIYIHTQIKVPQYSLAYNDHAIKVCILYEQLLVHVRHLILLECYTIMFIMLFLDKERKRGVPVVQLLILCIL